MSPSKQEPSALDNQASPGAGRPRSLRLPAAFFLLWLLALIGLALTSANPTTLNRRQLLQADVVVEAVLLDAGQGECRVVQSWPETVLAKTVTLPELSDLSPTVGEHYLLPLSINDEGVYQIVRTPPPDSKALIYPASATSRKQLVSILER